MNLMVVINRIVVSRTLGLFWYRSGFAMNAVSATMSLLFWFGNGVLARLLVSKDVAVVKLLLKKRILNNPTKYRDSNNVLS